MKAETDLQPLAGQWGAAHVPFAPLSDPDWLDTPSVQKAFTHLTQCATLRSVMLLSGPNGVGKSALAGRWMRGQDASFRRERNLQLIEASLAELDRRIRLIVLDEAQNYPHGSLEEVRLLLGLNLPQAPAFALILIGDEYLLSTLKLRNHRALYSRLACQMSLPPWTPAQCAQYLSSALQSAGLSSQSVAPAALEVLSSASGGLPRSLNLLARAAWIAAAMQGAQKIGPAHVQHALETVPCVPGMVLRPPRWKAPHEPGDGLRADRPGTRTLRPVDRTETAPGLCAGAAVV